MDLASLYPRHMVYLTDKFEDTLKMLHEERMWVKRVKERRIKLEKILSNIS